MAWVLPHEPATPGIFVSMRATSALTPDRERLSPSRSSGRVWTPGDPVNLGRRGIGENPLGESRLEADPVKDAVRHRATPAIGELKEGAFRAKNAESAVQNGEHTPSRHREKRKAADHRSYFLAIEGIASA